MSIIQPDTRSVERKLRDEQIAGEPEMAPPDLTAENPLPLGDHLHRLRKRPVAVLGIVENGLVRPLDPAVKFAEHARVIIVTTETI